MHKYTFIEIEADICQKHMATYVFEVISILRSD